MRARRKTGPEWRCILYGACRNRNTRGRK